MIPSDERLDRIVDALAAESTHDYVGLWQVVRRVSKADDKTSEETIRHETLEMVRALLHRGLVVGRLTREGGFEPWINQDPNVVLEQIDAKWRALGRRPDIDDICWLNLPTSVE